MGQEFYVVRCFSCAAFQSHHVRKDKKFVCKLCGEKQSVRKVYGRGSGKDCRMHAQKLNTIRRSLEEEQEAALESQLEEFEVQTVGQLARQAMVEEGAVGVGSSGSTSKVSKWSKYLSSDSEEEDHPELMETTAVPVTASGRLGHE